MLGKALRLRVLQGNPAKALMSAMALLLPKARPSGTSWSGATVNPYPPHIYSRFYNHDLNSLFAPHQLLADPFENLIFFAKSQARVGDENIYAQLESDSGHSIFDDRHTKARAQC